MRSYPECIWILLADKDHAGLSLPNLTETSWLAKWKVRKVAFWKESLIHKPMLN